MRFSQDHAGCQTASFLVRRLIFWYGFTCGDQYCKVVFWIAHTCASSIKNMTLVRYHLAVCVFTETEPLAHAIDPSYRFPLPGFTSPNLSQNPSEVEFIQSGNFSASRLGGKVEDDMSAEEFEKALASFTEEITVQPIGDRSLFGQVTGLSPTCVDISLSFWLAWLVLRYVVQCSEVMTSLVLRVCCAVQRGDDSQVLNLTQSHCSPHISHALWHISNSAWSHFYL